MSRKKRGEHPDEVRMSLGEHLDELRLVLMRCLVALAFACAACLWPARYVFELLSRPLINVLRQNGQPDTLLSTSPAELILVYVKVALFTGLIVVLPYIAQQIWAFVGAGLYQHERRWVRRLVPLSVALFLAGAAFMYIFVLTVSLNFLVSFSSWIPQPSADLNVVDRFLLHAPAIKATSQPTTTRPTVPIMNADPAEPRIGEVWFNAVDGRLRMQGDGQTYSLQLQRDSSRGLVTPHFRISEYLSFVLLMMVAFGVAFQTPLVVVFLVSSGILEIATIRAYRKVVWLVIVFIAGILAPPDVVSHLMLSVPMVCLFELGVLIAARRVPANRLEKNSEDSASA